VIVDGECDDDAMMRMMTMTIFQTPKSSVKALKKKHRKKNSLAIGGMQ